MRILHWILTTDCQLACRYCPYITGKAQQTARRPSLSECRRLIPLLSEHFDEIAFTGGEPLLHADFWKIAELVRREGLRVSLLTNGLGFSKVSRAQLAQMPIDRISISLDSVDPVINDSLRRPHQQCEAGLCGERVRRNVERLAAFRHSGVIVEVLQTITPLNLQCVDEMIQFCGRLNIDLFLHPVGIAVGETKASELRWEDTQDDILVRLQRVMERWALGHPEMLRYVRACVSLLRGGELPQKECHAARTRFVLDADGSVYPCFLRMDVCIGNVFHEGVPRVFGQDNVRRINAARCLRGAPCASVRCVCLVDCEVPTSREITSGAKR